MKAAQALLALALVATLLAGCSGKSPKAQSVDEAVPDLGLEATPSTGVIRGVVVDDAIRPLGNASVTAHSGEVTKTTVTHADGFFGFEGLQPGTWFLQANKTGYTMQQSSTEVVAGVSEPRAVKLQLLRDVANTPFADLTKFDGYLECGLSVIALCGVGTGLPVVGNVTNDKFSTVVAISKPPTFIQSEMVWQATTAASDQLWMWHSQQAKGGGYNGSCNCWVQGPSPLVMVTNETGAADNEYGTNNDLDIRIFTGSVQGTRNPADDNGCYPGSAVLGPDGDVYCGGVGYSVQQPFTIYTTVFYGYLPPDGWTFVAEGTVPQPPQ